MRSSNSAKEGNCKNNNFVKKFATEQISWCTVFNGEKTTEFKSDQILHVGKSVQTAIGKNQI